MDPATITPSHTTHMEQEGRKVLLESGTLFEDWLKQSIDWSKWPDHLAEAVRYGLLGGGKRLRPVLVLQCCRASGGRDDVALTAGGALELVHCFSLIHDDLPSLDNDELRRGQPTLHVHAGEPMAILAGDLMLAMAFGLLAQAPCDAAVRATLVDELATGTSDMVAGQVYDTLGGLPATLPPVEQVKLVHRKKTGALIRAACRMGGHCAGADDDTIHALTTYGEAMGLMFQIVDDLLDVTQSTDHVGKATGKDADSGKRTYPGVLGIEACQQEVERLRAEAVQALQPLKGATEPLAALAEIMAIRTN
ncbi:MAG: polyprenyl synthetase family protein [Phycisphaerales bacterium]|nr:polyprenyl synthetase family protein [Phycisphaerales bacterium]